LFVPTAHHLAPGLSFAVLETSGDEDVLQLRLYGELDLCAADGLSAHLAELIDAGRRVRLDLAQLDFIDSSGLGAILRSVLDGRRDGHQLVEVDPNISRQVQRVVDLAGVGHTLWPKDSERD
jgi:anti-anti-sigma factor